MKREHQALSHCSIVVDVTTDGPSLPMLNLTIKYSGVQRAYVFFNKYQAEELVRDLQSRLTEL